MNAFSDKAQFTLKELIGSIIVSLTIGGGIVRYETRADNIETKLDNLLIALNEDKVKDETRFVIIEKDLIASNNQIRAITTSLTAMLKPDEIEIRKKR
jgi:hypothetical protein